MEKTIQRYGKAVKVIWTSTEDLHDVYQLVKKRGRPIVVTHQEEGFPLKENQSGYPGLQTCQKLTGERGKPVCCEKAVWREKHRFDGNVISTGYFCDAHLEQDLRPEEGKALSIPDIQGLDQTMTDIAGQLAPSSQRIYASDARHFANWMITHGLTPQTMTRSEMIAYRSYLAESSYSKPTKQRMFSVASRLMNEQYINGQIPAKVTQDVKGFRTDHDETTHTALAKSQARDMLNAIDTSTKAGKRDYALILALVKTGLRRAELVALNRSDVRMMDGHHVAIVQHGKGDKRRIVKLRVDVWRGLEDYLKVLPPGAGDSPLFVSFRKGDRPTDRRITDKAVELLVKKYAPRGTDLTPHGLRATFATLALESGAPLHQVQYALGHADPRTTERYQKRKLNLDDNAVDVLNF